MNILFLEPSKVYQQVITKAMSAVGVETSIAVSPSLAVEMASSNTYDMICVPLYLDNTTGPDMAKMLREASNDPSMPVILLTTNNEASVQERSLEQGITDVFSKSDISSFANYVYLQQSRKSIDTTVVGEMLFVGDGNHGSESMLELFKEAGLTVKTPRDVSDIESEVNLPSNELIVFHDHSSTNEESISFVSEVRKQHPSTQEKPILAILPRDKADLRLDLLKAGANDVVDNNVSPEEILIRTNNLILTHRIDRRIKEQQKHLESIVMNDPVTSLFNKHCLLEVAPKFISEAIRYRMQIGMLLIQIDRFSDIVEEHGNQIADVILIDVANLLRNNCRNEDLIARIEKDKFAIMLSHCDNELSHHKAWQIVENIRKLKPEGIEITASVGTSSLEEEMRQHDHVPYEVFHKIAEYALEQGKKKGVNQVSEGFLSETDIDISNY